MQIDTHRHFRKYHAAKYDWIAGEMSVIRKKIFAHQPVTTKKNQQ